MPFTNYDKGFPNGVSIRQVPILDLQNNNGYTLWVDSTTGQDGNDGTFTYPLKTLVKAVEILSSASDSGVSSSFYRCNKVIIAAGHTETITTAVDFTYVDNTQIFGMGCGDSRPKFTLSGATTTAGLKNLSNGSYISNCVFDSSISAIVSVINIIGGSTVENCEFWQSTNAGVSFIDITASATNNIRIIGCKFKNISVANDQAIYLNAAMAAGKGALISGCDILGNFVNAPIHNPTGKVIADLVIRNNVCQNTATGKYAILIVSACTGTCADNYMYSDAYATMLDPGSLKCFNNVGVDNIDAHGVVMPVA
jgi:hypothetical protein